MIPDFLECPLCFDAFNKVIETPCCHRCYCEKCLDQWISKSTSKTCPECRAPLDSISGCVPNIPFQRLINELPVQCPNKPLGCNDKLTRGILEDHKKICLYVLVDCEYGGNRCQKVLKKNYKEHAEGCPFRPVPCELCSASITKDKLEEHLGSCVGVKVGCPNKEAGCMESVPRGKVVDHVLVCDFERVGCCYEKEGCAEKVQRAKMEEHIVKFAIEHHKMSREKIKKMEKELSDMSQTVDRLVHERTVLKSTLEQLTVLIPPLKYSPQYEMPLLLPTFFIEKSTKKVAYINTDTNTAGLKSSSFSSWIEKSQTDHRSTILIGNVPVTNLLGKLSHCPYYFEIKVVRNEGAISVGFVKDDPNIDFNGSLGIVFGTFGMNISTCVAWGNKTTKQIYDGQISTVGCGWDPIEEAIFYVINGQFSGTTWRRCPGPLIPAVGFSGGSPEIQYNFGTSEFSWDPRKLKQANLIQKDIYTCLLERKCTFFATGDTPFYQNQFGCRTCKLHAMCQTCALLCHDLHDLVPAVPRACYCECGSLTIKQKAKTCRSLSIQKIT